MNVPGGLPPRERGRSGRPAGVVAGDRTAGTSARAGRRPPGLDLRDPLRPLLRAVVKPDPPAVSEAWTRAGVIAGSGRAAPRSGAGAVVRRTASACAATGPGSARISLLSALLTGSDGSLTSWWPSSDAITRPSASGAERQRRQPHAPSEPVTAVTPVADSTGMSASGAAARNGGCRTVMPSLLSSSAEMPGLSWSRPRREVPVPWKLRSRFPPRTVPGLKSSWINPSVDP